MAGGYAGASVAIPVLSPAGGRGGRNSLASGHRRSRSSLGAGEYTEGSDKFNLDFYLWIGAQFSNLVLRKDITIEIPLNGFDEEKYNNTALITLKLFPDTDTYSSTLDGFETK